MPSNANTSGHLWADQHAKKALKASLPHSKKPFGKGKGKEKFQWRKAMLMVIQEPLCLFESLSTPQVPPQQELVENCPNLTTIAGF